MAKVTPLAGVWVEMGQWRNPSVLVRSLPLRECGLKSW